MIRPLAENSLSVRPIDTASSSSAAFSLDQRLLPKTDGGKEDGGIDRLYEQLKQLWQADPGIGGGDIIEFLNRFVAEDGDMPYQDVLNQTPALGQVLNKLSEEGNEGSGLYTAVYEGFGVAAVSSAVLNQFISEAILSPPSYDF
ncbi:hypothetical protein [Xanthomonas theicola]|uniref:Uncharacterized protein n=1 Tax=Xanthomonas theicola TaxID=56464 RepID=A0A2S6ZDW1_9XANT|nr:hypothetical protein [Xanthomonas theicola]PPT90464.1 hypothetical protein XthCFBP4691_12360 [Xanthomonas theicola]QNH25230.1 hypothetical protein G4Q83_11445 [Xanthomonas theicola]